MIGSAINLLYLSFVKKRLTEQEAREKINRYCAYQERSHLEVRNKLYEYGLFRDEVDEIISSLISDGFLNEERFAKVFAGGKFRMKKWGRIKIVHALEAKGVTKNCIRLALNEIDDESYKETLSRLIDEKSPALSDEKNEYVRRDKLSKFLIKRGFEPELVWTTINAMVR